MPDTTKPDTTRLVNILVFIAAVLLWAAFAVLILLQGYLAGLWQSFQAQPWPLQALEWVLFLPWLLAVWIWQTDWTLWLRLPLVVAIAAATVYLLAPSRFAASHGRAGRGRP